MKIEQIQKNDIEKIWELESLSFSIPKRAKKTFLKEISPYNGYKIVVKDKIASAVFFQKRELNFGEKIYNTAAVSYVATLPEYRGQRHIRKIFELIIPEFKKDTYLFTTLYAFKMEYYKKFNYSCIGQEIVYKLKPEIIPSYSNQLYEIEYVKKEKLADYIKYFNTTIFKSFNGMYKKNKLGEELYETWFLEFEGYNRFYRILLRDKNGNIKGTFSYVLKREKEKEKMMVFNVFLFERKGYETFLNYLHNFRDQVDEITIYTNVADRFEYLINTLYFKKEIESLHMGRVLNIKALLKELPFEDGTYEISIKDQLIKENEGSYTIKIQNGKKKITKKSLLKSGMDIGLFTQLLFLDSSLEFYSKKDFITKKEYEFFKAIKDRKIAYTTEHF